MSALSKSPWRVSSAGNSQKKRRGREIEEHSQAFMHVLTHHSGEVITQMFKFAA